MAAGSRAVLFPGWLNTPQIRHVMSISDIGVMPYNSPDFHMNMPNKVAEYFSGGLPILSCTEGEVRALLEREGCGFWCEPSEEAIVATVTRLAADRPAIALAANEARRVFNQMFEADAVFGSVVERFEAIVEDRAGQPGLADANAVRRTMH
jgi:glycosyltransferase involved in cell wall biosynthesis